MYGFVYIAYCDAFPRLLKIGFTDRSPSQRLAELSSSTSSPCEFDLLCVAEVQDAAVYEKEIHTRYANRRFRSNREFFELEPDELDNLCVDMEQQGVFCWKYEFLIFSRRQSWGGA